MHLGTVLDGIQSVSGLSLSAFLVVHLAAPASVLLSGGNEEAANSMMLIGRELYQAPALEPVLWVSLGAHIVSGIARRVWKYRNHPSAKLRPAAMVAYPLVPLVGLHVLLHRGIPSSPDAPILSLSPVHFDFSFVSYFFHSHPLVATLSYTTLLAFAVYHSVAGLSHIISRRRRPAAILPSRSLRAFTLITLACCSGGLYQLAASSSPIPQWLASRYHHVLATVFG